MEKGRERVRLGDVVVGVLHTPFPPKSNICSISTGEVSWD